MFEDQYRKYNLGDPVILTGVQGDEEPTEGRVVHIFKLPTDSRELYVVEFETFIDSVYEVRSGHKLHMRPAKGSMEYDSWGT